MFHAFTLPVGGYRVYNWHIGFGDEQEESVSIQSMMEEVYGKGAVRYADEFLKNQNDSLRSALQNGGKSHAWDFLFVDTG